MAAKFQFYEIVRVKHQGDHIKPVKGFEGAIMGMVEDHRGWWAYSVHLYEYDSSTYFREDELESTGRMDNYETFYDGTHITVRVDPETLEGRIVDDQES